MYLRSIDHPSISTQYTAHTATTTVARFSPSGYYVASGDTAGTVKIWDCVGEGATKGDFSLLPTGKVNDLAWDGESQRIVVVGNGRERFGACISLTGNSVGEISGHSSQINSVSVRQQRPLRAATGSDDTSTVFYHGAPFKFNTSLRGQHNRFIYGVAFSPDGSSLVSVGADRKIWLYDGKSGEVKSRIGDGEHKGSIFSVSWAKDSKRFVTSSADQTVKIWDAEAGKSTQTWHMGEDGAVSIADHQVGVIWPSGRADGLIMSLNLAGDFNYFNEGSPRPQRIVHGNQKNITALEVGTDTKTLWTGSSEGRICQWNTSNGACEIVDGESHTNYVSGLSCHSQGCAHSVGWDDKLRSFDGSAKTFTGVPSETDGQPKGVATIGDTALVATHRGIDLFINGRKTGNHETKFSPLTIAASGNFVAVGGDDHTIHIFTLEAGSLRAHKDISEPAALVTTLSFSPDQSLLAAGFSSGKITVYHGGDWSIAISRWSSHVASVKSIAWNKSGSRAASCSLDGNIYIWSIAKPGARINVANAHKDGVNGIRWIDGDTKVVTAGGDGALKTWTVEGLT